MGGWTRANESGEGMNVRLHRSRAKDFLLKQHGAITRRLGKSDVQMKERKKVRI